MSDAQLFSDTFTIHDINAEKYDRVARLKGKSTDGLVGITLDVNSELFPVQLSDRLEIVLANTLRTDGAKDDDKGGWRDLARSDEPTLADLFDYVCYGTVYRVTEDQEGSTIKVYVSFGGLLLVLEGPFLKLTGLKIEHLYMCVRKD